MPLLVNPLREKMETFTRNRNCIRIKWIRIFFFYNSSWTCLKFSSSTPLAFSFFLYQKNNIKLFNNFRDQCMQIFKCSQKLYFMLAKVNLMIIFKFLIILVCTLYKYFNLFCGISKFIFNTVNIGIFVCSFRYRCKKGLLYRKTESIIENIKLDIDAYNSIAFLILILFTFLTFRPYIH